MRPWLLLAFLAGCAAPQRAPQPMAGPSTLKELGSMAWQVPPRNLASLTKTARLFVVSGLPGFMMAVHERAYMPAEVKGFRAKHAILCEVEAGFGAEAYALGSAVTRAARVLAMPALPSGARLGWKRRELNPADDVDFPPKFDIPSKSRLRRGFAWDSLGGASYSFLTYYESSEHELRRSVLLLRGPKGAELGFHQEDLAEGEEFCADCATPTWEDGPEAVFSPFNLMESPAFPHPILFLDTGTVEGHALSLASFNAQGKYEEERFYEYTATCRE